MFQGYTVTDGAGLCGLLANFAGDIMIKTDARGFVTEASPGLDAMGFDLAGMLFAPHVSDLAERSHTRVLRSYCKDALTGMALTERIEFPATNGQDGRRKFSERWYAISLQANINVHGEPSGGIGIMRSIDKRRPDEGEWPEISTTDPLTGLANRKALEAKMSRLSRDGAAGSVILFGIDRFRAITLQYGQSKADEVLWAFAQFLRTMLGEQATLSRIEAERFAAIIPDIDAVSAIDLAEETVATFSRISADCGLGELRVAVSGGVAAIGPDSESVLASADLALTIAQAGGGSRVELGTEDPILTRYRKRA